MMPINNTRPETAKPASSNYQQYNLKTSSARNLKRSSDETLFETLMSDPVKKAFLLTLLTNEKENIKKYKQEQNKTPKSKHGRLYCESPTALLRRKALEKNGEQSSPSSCNSPSSTPVQFDRLLQGVVAYVEIRSKGTDRSAGAKTLVGSMGAKVVERLERGVTHVIFKDGSFGTYQKAKLLKAHLVSVLWLEAIRKCNYRVPEKSYPALGTEAYDVNVSEIFQEYESVVNEEYRRSLAVGSQQKPFESQRKSRITSLPSELALHRMKNTTFTPRRNSNIVPSSQEYEVESIISSRSIHSSKTNSVMDAETSDNDSECGLINGRSFSQLKDSLIGNLDNHINQYEERVSLQNEKSPQDHFENNDQHEIDESTKSNQSNIVQGQNDQSVSTSSSRSVSLLSRNSTFTKTINTTTDMDITNNITDSKGEAEGKSFKRKNLHFGVETKTDHQTKKNRRSTQPVPKDNNTESSLSCVELSDIPLLAPPATTPSTHIPKHSEIISSIRISGNTETYPIGLENQISTQSKDVQSQNKIEKPPVDECSGPSRGSKNSDSMSTLRISSDTARTSENSIGIRRSSRLSKCNMELSSDRSQSSLEQPLKINKEPCGLKKASIISLRTPPDSAAKIGNSEKSFGRVRSNHGVTSSDGNVLSILRVDILNSQNVTTRKSIVPHKSKVAVSTSSKTTGDELQKPLKTTSRKSKPDGLENNLKQLGSSRRKSVPTSINTTLPLETVQKSHNLRRSRKSVNPALPLLTEKSTENQLSEVLESSNCTSQNNRVQQNRKSSRLTKSIPELLTNNESQNSKIHNSNSDNMPNLRISADSVPKSGNDQSIPEDIQNKLSQNNLRRSLRRSTTSARTSKNSETMSSLRISSESVLSKDENGRVSRKSPRLNKSSYENHTETFRKDAVNTQTTDGSTTRGKKMRKLYNLNHSVSKIQELAGDDINKVEALPLSTFGLNAKTLVVPLTRLVLPANIQKSFKTKKAHTKDSASKNIKSVIQPTPTVRPTLDDEPNNNSSENPTTTLNDKTGRRKRRYSLTIPNVSLLQSQTQPQGSRRSTLEFIETQAPKRKFHQVKNVKTSIACTRMHKQEVELFKETVQRLGSFYVEDEVGEKTTHLIVGESKRTINLLRAIAMGCWILTKDWLLKSIEAEKWVQEEDYELTDFSSAVKQCRTERQAFGQLYSMDIFNDCDPIYISPSSKPKRSDLIQLIKLCRGTIARERSDAKIVIGDWVDRDGVNCVTEKWVLDSVTFNKKKSFNKYLISS